jgi:hypothetical protein
MRDKVPDRLEKARLPEMSDPRWGMTGAFMLMGPRGAELRIIANDASHPDAQGWEHVSVSTAQRCPNWTEMCFVKDLFWGEDELVIQYHVPISEHINNHPYVLHMWRDTLHPHPRMPPSIAVGIKNITQEQARELGKEWGMG